MSEMFKQLPFHVEKTKTIHRLIEMSSDKSICVCARILFTYTCKKIRNKLSTGQLQSQKHETL